MSRFPHDSHLLPLCPFACMFRRVSAKQKTTRPCFAFGAGYHFCQGAEVGTDLVSVVATAKNKHRSCSPWKRRRRINGSKQVKHNGQNWRNPFNQNVSSISRLDLFRSKNLAIRMCNWPALGQGKADLASHEQKSQQLREHSFVLRPTTCLVGLRKKYLSRLVQRTCLHETICVLFHRSP